MKEVYAVVGLARSDYDCEDRHDILAVFDDRTEGQEYMSKLSALALGSIYPQLTLEPVPFNPGL